MTPVQLAPLTDGGRTQRDAGLVDRRVRRHPRDLVGVRDRHRGHVVLRHDRLHHGRQDVDDAAGAISVRTIGVLASCSAIAETRRPSVRVNVASDCASETSATVTRTPRRMTICTTSSCPARERRPKRPGLRVTKTNSTFIADTRATRRRGAGHDHAVPATERERDLNDEHSTPARRSVLLGVTVGVTALALRLRRDRQQGDTAAGATAAADGPRPATCRSWSPTPPAAATTRPPAPRRRSWRPPRSPSAIQVFNLPGAGGTVGLQRIVNEKGNGKLAMQMGLGVVGAAYTQKSNATLNDTTPIAKLIEEAGAIVVPKDSPYKDVNRSSPRGRPTPRRSTSAAARPPAAPTTCCRCSWPRPSASTPRPSATWLRRWRRAPAGAARQQDRLRRQRLRRVPRPGRGRRRQGPRGDQREAHRRPVTAGLGVFSMSYSLTALYYRLMGARVGRRTRIAPSADLGEFDLLVIGDDACIDESAIVRPFVLDGTAMDLKPISLGANVSIGTRATIVPGSELPADTEIAPLGTSDDPGAQPRHPRPVARAALRATPSGSRASARRSGPRCCWRRGCRWCCCCTVARWSRGQQRPSRTAQSTCSSGCSIRSV